MNSTKKMIYDMLEDIPEKYLEEVAQYIFFVKRRNDSYNELLQASSSSTDFWDNPVDDEVWNHV